jgi:membrane associated rhomboid family serine protease
MNSWTLRLIIANVAFYFLAEASPGLMNAMALIPEYVLARPWTLVTYMFMHGGFPHILFNMLGLYFFGPRLEEELGGGRFLLLYFISGLMGAVLSFLTPHVAIIGASGAVYGIFLGFAYYWPRERIYIWGVIPIEARWLVIVMTALSVFGGFGVGESNTAHFAHLGGFVGAFLFLKLAGKRQSRTPMINPNSAVVPQKSTVERWARIESGKLHEVNRGELERVRAKIMTQGVESLTEQEIAFLDRFSQTE